MLINKKFKSLHDKEETLEKRRKLKESLDSEPLEKTDVLAMMLAAMITLLPALLVTIGIISLISWFFMR